MNVFLKARLFHSFLDVPVEIVRKFDWYSDEGQAFLRVVDEAVDQGVDINEIGSLLGVPNLSQRYRILSRSRRDEGIERSGGSRDAGPGNAAR